MVRVPQRLLLSSGAPPRPPLPQEVLVATAPSLPPRSPALHRRTSIPGFSPAFEALCEQAGKIEWVVHSKPPFGGPERVLKYLARYTHRVAISNHRLCTPENGRVSFEWKDYAHQGQNKIMTLDAIEFMRRFLLHMLPSGLVRIRQFGFLANRFRTRNLRLCRDLLAVGQTLAPSDSHNPADTDGPDHSSCPICKLGQLILIEVSTPNGPWFRTLHDTIARPFLVEFPHLASGFGRSPCTSQLSASKFVLTHLRPFLSLPPSLHTTPPVPFQAFWASCLSSCVLPAKMKDPDFTHHERNDGRLNGSRRETIDLFFVL